MIEISKETWEMRISLIAAAAAILLMHCIMPVQSVDKEDLSLVKFKYTLSPLEPSSWTLPYKGEGDPNDIPDPQVRVENCNDPRISPCAVPMEKDVYFEASFNVVGYEASKPNKLGGLFLSFTQMPNTNILIYKDEKKPETILKTGERWLLKGTANFKKSELFTNKTYTNSWGETRTDDHTSIYVELLDDTLDKQYGVLAQFLISFNFVESL